MEIDTLFQSLEDGDKKAFKALIKDNIELINNKNKDGKTFLHIAADNRNHKIVEILLSLNADVNVKDNDGRTALHLAAYDGGYYIVTLLLEKGADVNIRDNNGQTALYRALAGSNIDYDIHCLGKPSHKTYLQIVRELLQNGAVY